MSFPPASNGTARLRAVDGVCLGVDAGRTLAVVGESGCGKSVTALATLGLLSRNARVDAGSIRFRATPEGSAIDLLTLAEPAMRAIRGGDIAMIFQEPMTSLNPVFSVGEQVIEAIMLHQRARGGLSRKAARGRALDAMASVGIEEPQLRIDQYPHQFSGGMRQRIMIAMALACEPKLLLADEPTTALDVTVQAQVLELLAGLQREKGLGMMLITHDLGVVAQHAHDVCVMYAGRVVEYASTRELFGKPLHPYTRALLACAPRLGARQERLATVRDLVDDPRLVREFRERTGLSEDATPWWLWHAAPVGVDVRAGNEPHCLRQVLPNHWVGLWATSGAIAMDATLPGAEAVVRA